MNPLVPVAHVTSRLIVATVFVIVHTAEVIDWCREVAAR